MPNCKEARDNHGIPAGYSGFEDMLVIINDRDDGIRQRHDALDSTT
jgi:hypothetical protein